MAAASAAAAAGVVSAADMADAVDGLAREACAIGWADQPAQVTAAVRRVLRDSLAVLIAGGRLAESARRRAAFPVSDGPATVLGTTRTAGVCDAAWLNGCSLVALELDEGGKYIRGHATAHVLPAALAVAEAGHVPGPEFAAAFLAGHEVASRFGRATMLKPGVHPHGNWGVAGAAAACARLAGAGERQMAAAIDAAGALALATPFEVALAGLPVRDAWIGQANASGIRAWAAADAARGATGVAAVSLGAMLGTVDPRALTGRRAAGTGRMAILDGYLKRHASCSYTHPPADAALLIRERLMRAGRGPVTAAGLAAITVETHHLAAGLTAMTWPSRLAAMFSVPYVVATALRDGACPPESFDAGHRADPEVAALAAKVRVTRAADLDARLPGERAARVRLTWASGGTEAAEVPNPVGDTDYRPLSEADLEAKAAALLGPEAARRVRSLAGDLLTAPDVATVLAELREVAVTAADGAREEEITCSA